MSVKMAVMPYSHYKGACDAIREATSRSHNIKSGDLEAEIRAALSNDGFVEIIKQLVQGTLLILNIPEGTTSIRSYAFYSNMALEEVNIPLSVTKIGSNAFTMCYGITSITIPANVIQIGASAFKECASLNTVYCLAETPPTTDSSIFDGTDLTTIYVLQNSVEAYKAASGWSTYADIIKPIVSEELAYSYDAEYDGYVVTGIGTCTNTDIIIPNTYNGKAVVVIGESAFSGCVNIKNIVLPSSLERIEEGAFSGCYGLTSLTIPASVREISGAIIRSCFNIKTIIFEGTPTGTIDSMAFRNGISIEVASTITDIYVPWAFGAVANAQWGADDATVHYNTV